MSAAVAPHVVPQLNAFTIDVEDYFHVAALSSVISRDSWPSREYRAEANTERLLTLLGECGVRGTFFVLGWVAERSPQLVRRIAAAGHEIACHGFSHRLIYQQSEQEFRDETHRSKSLPRGSHRSSGARLPRRELLGHTRLTVGARCAHRPGIQLRLLGVSHPA